MVSHHQHLHGRAFHEDGETMELEKRGSLSHIDLSGKKGSLSHIDLSGKKGSLSHVDLTGHGPSNKDRFVHLGGQGQQKDAGVVTVYSQVYVTASKTFDGPAVYVTETPGTSVVYNSYESDTATTKSTLNSYESAKRAQHSTPNSYEQAKSSAHKPNIRSSTVANGVVGGTPLSTTRSGGVVAGTPLSATRGPELISQQSHGMSGGAKAGLAFGILAIIGLCAGLILFCIRRRKKQLAENGEKLDEKHVSQNSFFGGTAAAVGAPAGEKRESSASTRTASTAPRLSLRPVTQFLPNIMEANKATGPSMSEKPRSGWERPQNPFLDGAVASEKQAPANPFEDGDGKGSSTPNHSAKGSWAGSEVIGTAAAVPITAAGGGPRGPNNVHRVQLEFKPSMDDELELKSGQLVRMLHEYDDGWALCMRMDRSQQGVCPRTCLSKLPVKPRPQGPPPNGRPQGSPPQGFRGPPPQGPNVMMPRPLTPTGRERSNTAGGRISPSSPQEIRTRSQSVSAADGPVSPIDSSMPARKPVPGQAI